MWWGVHANKRAHAQAEQGDQSHPISRLILPGQVLSLVWL